MTDLAQLDLLVVGYARDRVASTCTLIRDGDSVIVVDPGMVADRALMLGPLARLGVAATTVTDVVISHHHPDHTVNVALFPNARVHDFAVTYVADEWIERPPGEFELSAAVRLRHTPGHTDQDQSTLVRSAVGLVALTHLWWQADGPADDPYALDRDRLRASREEVLALAPALIVPGHGTPFRPAADTPR